MFLKNIKKCGIDFVLWTNKHNMRHSSSLLVNPEDPITQQIYIFLECYWRVFLIYSICHSPLPFRFCSCNDSSLRILCLEQRRLLNMAFRVAIFPCGSCNIEQNRRLLIIDHSNRKLITRWQRFMNDADPITHRNA